MAMKRNFFLLVLVLSVLIFSVSVVGAERLISEEEDVTFKVGVGFMSNVHKSGIMVEGGVEISDLNLFFGMTPFDDQGLIIRALGADYNFALRDYKDIRPGLGLVYIAGDGLWPTASITLKEEEDFFVTVRIGYSNFFSASAGIEF